MGEEGVGIHVYHRRKDREGFVYKHQGLKEHLKAQKKEDLPLLKTSRLDQRILLFCALEYAVTRQSYVVGSLRMILQDVWEDLTPPERETCQHIIARNLDTSPNQHDRATWERILEWDTGSDDNPTGIHS